jgi:hypothetical protein
MNSAILLLALMLSAQAQTADNKAVQPNAPATDSSTANAVPADSRKVHADAVQLVELMGAREQVPAMWKVMVADGRKQMKEQCELCSAKFSEEWAKQMLARINLGEIIEISAQGYLKHFTSDEITALIEFQKKTNAHGKADLSPDLAAKFQAELPKLRDEFNEGCANSFGELGGKISSEIEHEHPEYLNTSDKSNQAN